jgi:DNA-binding response OmpR family regulator
MKLIEQDVVTPDKIKGQFDMAIYWFSASRYQPKSQPVLIVDKGENLEHFKNSGTVYLMEYPVRIGVLLDRIKHIIAGARTVLHTEYRFSHYLLKLQENRLLDMNDAGGDIRLTEKERDILYALVTAPGYTLSRQALMDKVWAYADGVETHTLETHIYRLRQKIEKDSSAPDILLTCPEGYVLRV